MTVALRWVSEQIARLTGRSAENIYQRGILGGRVWVWAIAPKLVGASVIHVHNRPSYVDWLRRLGITEPIVLHAHNDLVGSSQAAAQHSTSGQTPAAIVLAADHIIFCSEYLRERAEDEFGPLRSTVVHNGVAVEQVQFEESPPGCSSALWSGRLVPEKGALEAMNVIEELDDTPWHLTLAGGTAGSGASTYAREVTRRAEESPRCRAIGLLPHVEMLKEFRKHDVFLFPCQWQEPFGMVIVEAMASGAVVVAAGTGGIPEIIDDGRTGFLLPPEASPADYAEVLRTLTPAKAEQIRRAARAEVIKRFSWDAVAEQVIDVFAARGWLETAAVRLQDGDSQESPVTRQVGANA